MFLKLQIRMIYEGSYHECWKLRNTVFFLNFWSNEHSLNEHKRLLLKTPYWPQTVVYTETGQVTDHKHCFVFHFIVLCLVFIMDKVYCNHYLYWIIKQWSRQTKQMNCHWEMVLIIHHKQSDNRSRLACNDEEETVRFGLTCGSCWMDDGLSVGHLQGS